MRTFAECDPVGHVPEGAPAYKMPLGVRAHKIDPQVIMDIEKAGMIGIQQQRTAESIFSKISGSRKIKSAERNLKDRITKLKHDGKIHEDIHREVEVASREYTRIYGKLPEVAAKSKVKLNPRLDRWQTKDLYSTHYFLEKNWQGLDTDLKVGGTDEEHNNPYTI